MFLTLVLRPQNFGRKKKNINFDHSSSVLLAKHLEKCRTERDKRKEECRGLDVTFLKVEKSILFLVFLMPPTSLY